MSQRTASTLGFIGTIAAATFAAALMSSAARAQGPIDDSRPMTGARSQAEVRAEVMAYRQQLTSFGSELKYQQPTVAQPDHASTREQARAGYIAAREEVRAMTGEDSGSALLAHQRARAPMTVAGGATMR